MTTQRYTQLDEITHVRTHVNRALGDHPHTTAVREILDNAADEVTRGHATHVHLTIHPDNSYEIQDNGRGLQTDWYPKQNKNGIVAAIGTPRAGENFNSTTNTAGTHGEGSFGCNAISQRMDVTVYNHNKTYTQQFKQGRPGTFHSTTYDPNADFTPNPHQKLTPTKTTNPNAPTTGTNIRFTFDPTIAPEDEVNTDEIIQRAKMITWLTPNMTLTLTHNNTTHTINPTHRGTHTILTETTNLTPIATFQGHFTYTPPKTKKHKTVHYEITIAPTQDETPPTSIVNTVYTPQGGQHQDATLKALAQAATTKTLRNLKRKPGEPYPNQEAFKKTITAAISIKYPEPQYSGQDKQKLSESTTFANQMAKEITRQVEIWAQKPTNAPHLLTWAQHALNYTRTQQKITAAKNATKLHTGTAAKGSNLSLPDKYTPCKKTGPNSGAELLIGEGASAIGTIKAGRFAQFQACYELKGKPTNVQKTTLTRLRKTEEFAAIEALMRTGVKEHCDTSKRRFDRVIFSCDADVDGYNINSLLANLFITYYPTYVQEGRVYIATPPLFIVTSNNPQDRIMCIDEKDKQKAITQLTNKGRTKINVQRCKGLGEMNAKDFRQTVLDPQKRTLLQVTYDPDRDNEDLDIIFAGKAEQRREWMYNVGQQGYLDANDVMD